MTTASSIWLRDLTQSILTNKFHNTAFIEDAEDSRPYKDIIKVIIEERDEVRAEVSIEMFHNVYENRVMVSENRLVSDFSK